MTVTPNPEAEAKRNRRQARKFIGQAREEIPFGAAADVAGSKPKTKIRHRGWKGLSGKGKAGAIIGSLLAAAGAGAALERSTRPT